VLFSATWKRRGLRVQLTQTESRLVNTIRVVREWPTDARQRMQGTATHLMRCRLLPLWRMSCCDECLQAVARHRRSCQGSLLTLKLHACHTLNTRWHFTCAPLHCIPLHMQSHTMAPSISDNLHTLALLMCTIASQLTLLMCTIASQLHTTVRHLSHNPSMSTSLPSSSLSLLH